MSMNKYTEELLNTLDHIHMDRVLMLAAPEDLGLATTYDLEKLWDTLSKHIHLDEHLTPGDDEYCVVADDECWLPERRSIEEINKRLVPRVSVYPISGMRRLDTMLYRMFVSGYESYLTLNTRGALPTKICGNPDCCNPTHMVLISPHFKTILRGSTLDYRPEFKKALKACRALNLNISDLMQSIFQMTEEQLYNDGMISHKYVDPRAYTETQLINIGMSDQLSKQLATQIAKAVRARKLPEDQIQNEIDTRIEGLRGVLK